MGQQIYAGLLKDAGGRKTAIAGVSGSPIRGRNTDRLVKSLLQRNRDVGVRQFEEAIRRWEACPRTVAEVERFAQTLAELPSDSSPAVPVS